MLTTVQLKHHVQNVVSKKMEDAEEVRLTRRVDQQAIMDASESCKQILVKVEEDSEEDSEHSNAEIADPTETTPMEEELLVEQSLYLLYPCFLMTEVSVKEMFNQTVPQFIETSTIHDLCSKQIGSAICRKGWITNDDSVMV